MFEKVLERKNNLELERVSNLEFRNNFKNSLRRFAMDNIDELKSIFPYVIIESDTSDRIIGVSYSDICYIGENSYNIVLNCTGNFVNIGYGADVIKGEIKIPFGNGMSKARKYILCKQILEKLVAIAYNPKYSKQN